MLKAFEFKSYSGYISVQLAQLFLQAVIIYNCTATYGPTSGFYTINAPVGYRIEAVVIYPSYFLVKLQIFQP